MKKPLTNVAASVRDRLKILRSSTGQEYNTLLVRYTIERFLFRLSISEYRKRFVLKGAILFALWHESAHRITRDLDQLGFGEATIDELARITAAAERVEQIHGEEHSAGSSRVRELCADKGFHDSTELAIIQQETGARTIIGDAGAGRRNLDKMEPAERAAVKKAARAVQSKSGKALLRARGEHIERGFARVLDAGGLRRTQLRGRENIN